MDGNRYSYLAFFCLFLVYLVAAGLSYKYKTVFFKGLAKVLSANLRQFSYLPRVQVPDAGVLY